jgi:Bacteriocin-protection, YdeI or OmpD-Associated/Domain of unknown function (DUF1905)
LLRYHAAVPEKLRIFAGRIYKVGLIRYADVPAAVAQSLGREEVNLPVCGTVEGVPLRTTLVSRRNGCHRVAIHGDIRKKLRVDAGAVVEIAIERDEESREPVLPPALVVALRQSPRAQAVFKGMTTALRRQIVRKITSVKSQEALERRVDKVATRLEQMRMTKSKTRPTETRRNKSK